MTKKKSVPLKTKTATRFAVAQSKRHYWSGIPDNRWTEDPKKALGFPNSEEASAYIKEALESEDAHPLKMVKDLLTVEPITQIIPE